MVKSKTVVKSLVGTDPGFSELVETLFGGMYHPDDVWLALYGPNPGEQVSKMQRGLVRKMNPGGSDMSVPIASRSTLVGTPKQKKGTLRPAKIKTTTNPTKAGTSGIPKAPANKAPKPSTRPKRSSTLLSKADDVDVTYAGEFSKFDEDKRLAFGWSSIVKMDGQDVADRQGDVIDWMDLEDAAYAFMERSRAAGGMHKRGEDGSVHKVGDIVESFVVTPEKIEKMGLPDSTPLGWWIGMKVADDDAWGKVKKGEWSGFSIHGRGKRKALA